MVHTYIDCNIYIYFLKFSRDGAEAICRIPLSHRHVTHWWDGFIIWVECTHGKVRISCCKTNSQNRELVWVLHGLQWQWIVDKAMGLKVPNKIKVFGWRRACQNILPTRVNLARLRIIVDDNCELCKMAPETGLRVLWECGVAKDFIKCLLHGLRWGSISCVKWGGNALAHSSSFC